MWFWNLVFVIAIIIGLWWALVRQLKSVGSAAPTLHTTTKSHKGSDEAKVDDLTIIEGIGPKIASLLRNNGIETFIKLSETSPLEITELLSKSDSRLGRISDPATWPEQARMAANNDIEGLKILQGRLKGGRK